MKNSLKLFLFYLVCLHTNICCITRQCIKNSDSKNCSSSENLICCGTKQTFDCTNNCKKNCSTGVYCCGTSIYIPRSTGDNTAREFAGMEPFIHKYGVDENYSNVTIDLEYQRSFDPSCIAKSLFCTDCLTFSGSLVPNRTNSEVLADNFGLSPFFKQSLKIDPLIENITLDFSFYFGLDEWSCGLFAKMHVPVTHTRWDLRLNDCICTTQTCTTATNLNTLTCAATSTCFVSNSGQQAGCPYPNYYNGGCIAPLTSSAVYPTLREALSGFYLFGDMRTPWSSGRFPFCRQDLTRFADVDFMIGYNMLVSPCFHFSPYLKVIFPAGNRPKSETIFEPIVGIQHIALGVGFSSHLVLWGAPCDSYCYWGLATEGNVVHLFESRQKRSFDFINNGLLSRYLLLKEFASDKVTYTGNMINGISFATRQSRVNVNYQADISAKLFFRNESWLFDLGYNFYTRAKEQVCIDTHCPCDLDRRSFGIKGTTGTCSIEYTVVNGTLGTFVSTRQLNATESTSTIFEAGPIDNPVLVSPQVPGNIVVTPLSNQTAGTPITQVIQAQSSNPPVLIKCCDLDPNSAAQNGFMTHKIFTNLEYIWFDTCWQPYVSVGAEVEFDQKKYQPLHQWGIWLKTGLNY